MLVVFRNRRLVAARQPGETGRTGPGAPVRDCHPIAGSRHAEVPFWRVLGVPDRRDLGACVLCHSEPRRGRDRQP